MNKVQFICLRAVVDSLMDSDSRQWPLSRNALDKRFLNLFAILKLFVIYPNLVNLKTFRSKSNN